METYWKLSLTMLLTLFLFSCNQDETKSVVSQTLDRDSINLSDYFFGADSLHPYIYVYADEHKPLDEKIFRIYTLKTAEKHQLIVEKFNTSFRITEGFTYDLDDSLRIVDHMVVDGDGLKRKANLSAHSMFLMDTVSPAVFISDFPAPVDGLTAVYKSTKCFDSRFQNYEILDQKSEAIKLHNEIILSIVDPAKKTGDAQGSTVTEIYAQGLGLTEWFTKDKRIHYKLKRILSNDWWKENAQGPAVRLPKE